jgi:hypothetical protein
MARRRERETLYDPDDDVDPAGWLALSEQKRIDRILAYH